MLILSSARNIDTISFGRYIIYKDSFSRQGKWKFVVVDLDDLVLDG